jgi:hypothetical protein
MNKDGMVVRVLVKTIENKWKEICMWVPFGSSLLVRADLFVSACQQKPGSFSLQGVLLPRNVRGWDGRQPSYLSMKAGNGVNVAKKLRGKSADKWFEICQEEFSSHYLKRPTAYWTELDRQVACSDLSSTLIGKHLNRPRVFFKVPNETQKEYDYFMWENNGGTDPHEYKKKPVGGGGLKKILWKVK